MPRAFRNVRPRFTLLACLIVAPAGLAAVRAQAPPVPPSLTPDDLAIGCGPRLLAPPGTRLPLIGSQDGLRRRTYGPGDGIVVAGGATHGVQPGEWYYVRRPSRRQWPSEGAGALSGAVHTAGWIRITAVQQDTSIAEVVHACDGFMEGDYLDTFTPPKAPTIVLGTTEPDYGQTATILFGDEGRAVAGPGGLMLVDKGADAGLSFGQRATVFRELFGQSGPVHEVAAAVVVEVAAETAMIRIEGARREVYAGDRVALHPIR